MNSHQNSMVDYNKKEHLPQQMSMSINQRMDSMPPILLNLDYMNRNMLQL